MNTLFSRDLRKNVILNTVNNIFIGTIYEILNDYKLLLTTGATGLENISFLTNKYNVLKLDGDFLPSISDRFSLGNENLVWKNLHVGTITLVSTNGQKGNIALNQNDVIYFDKGSAGPYSIIGPTLNSTGEVGGWKLSPIGNPSNSTYDLVAQQVSISPDTILPVGPQCSLIRSKGQTGDTGPRGINSLQSGYTETTSTSGIVYFNPVYSAPLHVVVSLYYPPPNTNNVKHTCIVHEIQTNYFHWTVRQSDATGRVYWMSNGTY